MNHDLQPPPAEAIASDVTRALAEDLGSGDVTAALLPDVADIAYLLCKEAAVVSGRPWFDACHRSLDPDVVIEWRVAEGDHVADHLTAQPATCPVNLPPRHYHIGRAAPIRLPRAT